METIILGNKNGGRSDRYLGTVGAGNVFIGCNPSSLALRDMSQRSLILRHNFLTVLRTTRIKPHHCGQDPLVLVCGTFLYPHSTALWRSYPMCYKHLSTPEKHNYFTSLCAVKPSLLYIRALKPLPHRAGERGSSGLLSAHQL
jgi:hypothetical protein